MIALSRSPLLLLCPVGYGHAQVLHGMMCRQTAMQQELEKLRVKLRTADFVRSGSSPGLSEMRSASLPR